jgi:SecD/SecF fusion protein
MKYPLWKPLLIVLVIAGCGALMYPPHLRLKPGLDLAGGTTLVYDVKVPKDADAGQVIDDMINVLRDRVDPTGTRNLIWRQAAGNRIEIQMALANQATKDLRQKALDAREAVFAQNISKGELDAALRLSGEERQAQLVRLAGDHEQLLSRLEVLAEAYDRLAEATAPYEQVEAAYQESEQAATLRGDQMQLADLRAELEQKARVYLAAKKAFEAAQAAAVAENVEPTELQRVLDLPLVPKRADQLSRPAAMEQLVEAHRQREAEIRASVEAYNAYDKVRGPLDDPNDLIAMLRGSGVLEFRIAATPTDAAIDVASYRQQLTERGPRAGADKPWRWFEIDNIEQYASDPSEQKLLAEDPEAFFAQRRGVVGQAYGDSYYMLLADTESLAMTRDQAWQLSSAQRGADELGRPAINFQLNALGGQRMGQITGPNVGKPMAILMDNQVISAPNLNSKINDSGQITGDFTPKEVDYLLRTLKAGSAEAELGDYPISMKVTGPTLGQDNLRRGFRAAVYSLIAVSVFMFLYYFFAGVVADLALVANMIIILGVMAMFQATFTLPGIAGVVLTIGMAVDANVLIYERIREELERKAELATAIRLGYGKALSTIVDANLTTLITCVILFYTATAEIKGFATTLMIGVLATLFTALFCTRVVFELAMRTGKVRSISMLPLAVPAVRRIFSPSVNWVGKRYAFFAISAVLMIGGLVLVYERGRDMLDIEFRAGTQVSFQLAAGETLSIEEVRTRLAEHAEMAQRIDRGTVDVNQLSPAERQVYEAMEPVVHATAVRHGEAAAGSTDEAAATAQGEQAQVTADKEPVDFSLLKQASVVTEGEVQGTRANGFSVSTLVTDAQTVSAFVKAAFADVLSTSRPIDFAAMAMDRVGAAPVYPIRSRELGDNINRADVTTAVEEYLGGVAIVLSEMNPAPTLADLTERIRRMRNQPAYEDLGYRPFEVLPLDMGAEVTEAGEPTYRSAVVVTRDAEANYIDNPGALTDPSGLAATEWSLVRDALQRDTSLGSVSNFNSQVSNTMKQQAIAAMALSLLAVVVYIWFRFGSLRYGLAAIAALVHDVTIALGCVAISGWLYDNVVGQFLMLDPFKIDLALVAALLTIVGYSLNDTIVVFDRIRENRGRLAYATGGIVNDSINQTISRTVLTGGTTMIAVMILYVVGGPGVHGFAFAMLIGVVVGTYSSIAIASPILLMGGKAGQHAAVVRAEKQKAAS